ncbi:MAG: InlB B-repeat-containing protein, partial [Kiritimatiellae bacterium]|nr:InlB B-repeat-containing protein [Kiritimatiellia bacterium]
AYENGATVQNLLSENNGTIVLYAQWAAASVTLPEITLDDYSFKGWYTAESGGERIGGPGDSFTPTNNVTLYAQWSKLSYTVSFDPTGGEFVGEGAPIYVGNEEKYPALPEVTRVGYGFAGWYLHGDIEIKEGDTVNITSNSWAYADWTNNIYTVIFRKGEAFYGEEFSTNVFYDIPFELPKNSFECLDGSTFAGWRLPDGSLSSENTIVSNLATSGSVEIIATWEKPKDSLNASGACKNLYVTTILDDDYFLPWSVYEQEKDVLRSGSCEERFDSFLYALVKSPGSITFKWCATGAGINGAIEIGKDNSSMLAEFDGNLGYGEWKTESEYIDQAKIDQYGGWLTWHAWGSGSDATLYIKDVVWIPDGYTENDESVTFTYEDNDGTERTASVPKSWVDENNLLPTGSEDYKAALEASSGKIGSNGAALPYWYDYVAGTNPNDPDDIFRITSISVTNGTVFLTWHPDLSSDALAREYKVLGKASLSDPDESWAPTNSASRFFRVDVHLKK